MVIDLWRLIRALRKEEALACTRIIQCENGQDEQKKQKYRKIDDKIANLVANYKSENVMEFLKGIASNLHLF